MSLHNRKVNPEDDQGFGTQPVIKSQPVISKDGSINVKRTGIPLMSGLNSYQALITMPWRKFWAVVLSGYMVTNLIFASIYVALGPTSLDGKSGSTLFDQFMDAFFFSAQTISTVGYGHISPVGMAANCVAAMESMIGLLAFALATGLLYGRFSRPSAKIRYSDNILISPYKDGQKGLMFRLANERRNILIDLEMEVLFSFNDEVDGKTERKFFPLMLERKRVSILTLNWTVVHPIDEDSPIKDFTPQDFERAQVVFSVILKTFDDTFAQTIHSRTTYTFKDMVWNAKFKPAFDRDEDGRVVLHLEDINSYDLVE